MMKTIRVFVSSTGDVQKERHVAERVMRSIAAEFNLPVSDSYSIFQRLAEENGGPENGEPKTEPENHSPLVLCPYFLEYQRLQLDAGYQGAIPNTAEFDLVICILWSRLGSPVGPDLKDAGWQRARLGNGIRNWLGVGPRRQEQGRSAVARLPQLFEADAAVGTERGARSLWSAMGLRPGVLCAIGRTNSEGNFAGTFNNYRNLQEFEELFRGHFRDFLAGQVDQEAGQKLLSRKVRRWKSSPFRGLNVFDFEHAPIFHGRTRAIGESVGSLGSAS